MKKTISTFQKAKEKNEKITMLTCYDYSMARLMAEAGIDCLLIGDSLGQVILGYPSTLPVTVEDILHHTRAVSRGAGDSFVLADMPFLSYHTSVYDAVVNAGRLVKEGYAEAVKLEGGADVCEQITAIVKAQIPVCAHIGLTPQSVHAFGGFKVQGRTYDAAQKLIDDAKRVEDAGASMLVIEGVPAAIAQIITQELTIPTIGIGAGAGCDGQVLVYQDMLTMFSDFKPKFVKQFADVGSVMKEAFAAYIREVRDGSFPAKEHTYKLADEIAERLRAEAQESAGRTDTKEQSNP